MKAEPRSQPMLSLLLACALSLTLALGGAHASDPAARRSNQVDPNNRDEANKALVLDFYSALDRAEARGTLKQDIRNIANRYLRPDYIQHSEQSAAAGAGREGFVHLFQNLPEREPGNHVPPQRLAVMADGDRVILVTSRQLPAGAAPGGSPAYIFNMFRIRDGQLAEHWDGTSNGCLTGPQT